MSKDIFLYALSTCIHCKNTKKFLEENNIDYDFVYVDQLSGEEKERIVEEIKKYNPRISFPTLVVDGKKVIVGLKKDEIMEACQ
ncbi:glutaredoxin family protein [Desulfonatronovibrio hydrogenovorans]|uniref:glutaredoxin family protein n=1 Tax=Desulfonatronovibrio hydrogenovorans TaxID=53245 RepID=UPI00048FD6F3|nr:glutaredoxin family protein [Desulfonatronovibrio hydrogenovorans]